MDFSMDVHGFLQSFVNIKLWAKEEQMIARYYETQEMDKFLK